MKVREVMTTGVHTARPETPVHRVARLMVDHGVSGIPVVDDQDRLLGMVTEWNLVARQREVELPLQLPIMEGRLPLESPSHFLRRLRHVVGAHASDVMTEGMPTIGPEADLEEVATVMLEQRANPLPVVENERLIGIISRADIVRVMAREVDDRA